MQDIVLQLRGEDGRHGDRDEQLRRIHGKSAIEISGSDSDDGRVLPVQPKRLADRVGRGVEATAPETIADRDHGSVAGLVKFGAEQASKLGFDAEYGKVIGGNELSEDALGFRVCVARQADVEQDAVLHCSHSG